MGTFGFTWTVFGDYGVNVLRFYAVNDVVAIPYYAVAVGTNGDSILRRT